MSKMKTYDVLVVTVDEWAGSIRATSSAEARQLAEARFNEGDLQQCGEEITRIKIVEVRP
jgi:hypothetical protein